MKAAMGVQTAEELFTSFGLRAEASEQCVGVFTDGFVFRLFLFSERCTPILKSLPYHSMFTALPHHFMPTTLNAYLLSSLIWQDNSRCIQLAKCRAICKNVRSYFWSFAVNFHRMIPCFEMKKPNGIANRYCQFILFKSWTKFYSRFKLSLCTTVVGRNAFDEPLLNFLENSKIQYHWQRNRAV